MKSADIWQDFFELTAVGGLRDFAKNLDLTIPEHAALAYYISTWKDFSQVADGTAFLPRQMVSLDRSAIMYGKAPVIFQGTNNWSWKPYLSRAVLNDRINKFAGVIAGIREDNPSARIALLLVPEKDYVVSRLFLKENRFANFVEAVGTLDLRMKEYGVSLVHWQPFYGSEPYQSLADFLYPDSHLTGYNYVTIFGFLLEALGIPWSSIKGEVGLCKLPEFGDLAAKFDSEIPRQYLAFQPDMIAASAIQTGGFNSFAEPLGETWQEFENDSAKIDESVCLLGDSHCSIYAQRKLSYLFANTFRSTRFEWNPCGTRKKPGAIAVDSIVCEISSRFVV